MIEHKKIGGEVILKHTRNNKVLRHESVKKDNPVILEDDPRFKKKK
jgi:hypothetical protein